MFGIIGTIGEGLATGQDSHEYGDFSFAKNIQDSLRQYLQENNFKVIQTAVNRGKKVALVKDYDSLDIKGVDAYLDVVPLEVGYKQSDLGGIFYEVIGPILSVVVRLVSARTKEVLYADTISYGWAKATTTRGVDIESPPEHQFTNKADLKANKERAIEQLIQGIERVSLEIARNFTTYDWYSAKLASLSDNDLSDLNIGSDDELLFLGMAAAEITSKSYDQALWEKALALAGGDEQKRNGIYIKLRSNQLALEKKNAQAAANQGNQSLPGSSITATYKAKITYSCCSSTKYPEVVLTRSGNKITGVVGPGTDSGEYVNEIVGTMKGNIIKFDWYKGGSLRSGTWKVSDDGTRIEGEWSSSSIWGKWTLNAIGKGNTIAIANLNTNQNKQSVSGPNITGTYVSEITSNHARYFRKKYRKLVITFKQDGNSVTASDNTYKVDIWGTRDGDIIFFDMGTNKMNDFNGASGKWKINVDGTRLEGSWEASYNASGKWNLTRIQ